MISCSSVAVVFCASQNFFKTVIFEFFVRQLMDIHFLEMCFFNGLPKYSRSLQSCVDVSLFEGVSMLTFFYRLALAN